MEYPRLLIAGDSFSSSPDLQSWVNLIHSYHVTNISECGIGEYKIWKALAGQDITKFDKVIVSHTSAARLHIKQNPWYVDHTSHSHADLLYSDVCDKPNSTFRSLVKSWFEQVVDLEYQDDIHAMIVEKIQSQCVKGKTKHITFFDYDLPDVVNLQALWLQYPGTINHMNVEGNQKVFESIRAFLYD